MDRYISLLRGINVSGQKKIKMADLKSLYEGLGFENVETYIQSGNVAFNCDHKDVGGITSSIVSAIEKSYGFIVPVLVLNKEQIEQAYAQNPFAEKEGVDGSKLHVTLLDSIPEAELLDSLKDVRCGDDEYLVIEKKHLLALSKWLR